jgi:SPX domain protein involved in polyphosphate accumulation
MLRYEYKYFVPYEKLDRLRSMLKPFMELDSNACEHGGEYTVRSIYFDTPDWDCYVQKVEGVKRRNKVRLRGYNGGNVKSEVFFEIKKKVDEPLYKNRAALSYEEAQQVMLGKSLDEVVFTTTERPAAVEDAQRFLYHLRARRMRPVITVIYEREPYEAIFFDKENDMRITLDKNLRAVAWPALDELFEEKQARPVEPRRFIMEIKFNRYLPNWAKAVVSSLGLTKGPASKYVLCVAAFPEMRECSKNFYR